MFRVLSVLLFLLVYGQLGYVIARLSLQAWLQKDNRSKLAFLLFPVSYKNRTLGDKQRGHAFLTALDYEREPFDTDGYRGDLPGRAFYYTVMLLFWPFKVLFNLPMALILVLFTRVSRRLGSYSAISGYVTGSTVSVGELFAERREIDQEIRLLTNAREKIDSEINRRRSESRATFENEEELDRAMRDPNLLR